MRMDDYDSSSGANSVGMQFSIAGDVIMSIIYVLQVTETASFPLEPTVSLSVAAIAAIGALLFYTSRNSREM
jgi:hypothetical protein